MVCGIYIRKEAGEKIGLADCMFIIIAATGILNAHILSGEMVLLFYDHYQAYTDNGEALQSGTGENNRLRLFIPGNYEGKYGSSIPYLYYED